MAADLDLVELSLKINSKLPPQLEKAVERNVVLRIGWTSSGDQVPKNGELGLCPNLPPKSKVRSLGILGSFVAAFGKGGTYTHQGEIGSFFGAYLGGYFYDLYGSYDYAWYISIVLSIFATLVHLPIDEKPIARVDNTI